MRVDYSKGLATCSATSGDIVVIDMEKLPLGGGTNLIQIYHWESLCADQVGRDADRQRCQPEPVLYRRL